MAKNNSWGVTNIEAIDLTQEQECRYMNLYKHSTSSIVKNEALEMLVRSKMKLVMSIARKFAIDTNNYEDFIHEGYKGLIIGINKFDETKGIKLGTYVYMWIVQSIQRSIGNYSMIYIPEEVRKLNVLIYKVNEQYKQEHNGINAPIDYIVETLGLTYDKVVNAKSKTLYVYSYDSVMESSEKQTSFVDTISDGNELPSEVLIEQEIRQEFYEEIYSSLNEKELYVLEHYFGINNCEKTKLNDIAKHLHLSEARIKQIKKQALDKLHLNSKLEAIAC